MEIKPPTVRFSGTLPVDLSEKLKEISILKERSMNFIITVAVREYVEKFFSKEYNDIIKG